ncbi:MBL fold metallo-hydrolase [Helicobacter sp. MIT 14-3879]|uniref:MBL fold metallo-hydrolase n=1 Tax=Helicobacter sp. MIT 14-3879 TaxID=2040649 RepID=UPI0015F1A51C|nr:MBL fold metallo-hydrolase [Helicobacter sp. MIT 14-3879]
MKSIKNSSHFHNGRARNHSMVIPTSLIVGSDKELRIIESYTTYPKVRGNKSMFRSLLQTFFMQESVNIPSVKSDIKTIPKQDSFVWFGHSSYMLWLNNKTILLDPVLDSTASPLPFVFKPFKGADIFSSNDLPSIDYLVITHNHYDHLSKISLMLLKDKIGHVIVPLGIGKYLKSWGIEESKIIELDWEEEFSRDDFTFYCLPTQHYSARNLFDSNTSLWACFVLEYRTSESVKNIYFSGDSGYGGHFKVIGKRFRKIDFAFIENGQYNIGWAKHHLFPHQSLQAALDLNAEKMMPIHNSKFKLAPHFWSEPLELLYALYQEGLRNNRLNFSLITSKIGEITPLWKAVETLCWWQDL